MLFPKVVDVSEKGQILIPVGMRKALGVRPKSKVFLLPFKKENKIEVKPIKKSLVEELCGVFADVDKKSSWAKELLEERQRDLKREEKGLL